MNSLFFSSSPSLGLFLLLVLVLFDFPVSLGNPDELYKYNTCSKEFNCGNITGVSYPFWGSDRPLGCGHLDLQLNCHDGIATIEIMGVNYRVLSFNKDAQTLRIARQDYLKGICSPLLVNTTLDPKLFDYAAVYQYVTFFYGCPYSLAISVMPQKFSCSIAGIPLKDGYFVASPQPQGPGPCNVSVFVPILSTSILEGIGKFQNLDQLIEGVIGEGIEVRLNVDGTACSECLESKGVCGYDIGLNQTTCYCKDQLQASKTCGSPTGTGGNNVPKTVGYSVLGAVLLGIFLGCLFYFLAQRRRRASKAKSKDLPTPPSSKGIAPSLTGFSESIPSYPYTKSDIEKGSTYFGVQVFSYMELEEATNNFDPSRELGDGGFGTVYYGKLQDGRVVAVKRLYENNFKRVEQFMNEVQILTRLQHQNLVKLYGCTSRRSRELLLVYEYIPNGTVADHLHGKQANSGSITWPVRLSIAIETANALAYLHESEIIHRDVKTNNILLDNNFQVKVADFGLSRLFPTDVTHVSTAPQGTPGYVDPEYHQCYQLTSKSDVYSFGVVLMELISSKQAVDTNRHRHDINLANMAVNKILNHTLHELVDPSLGFESDSLVRRKITLVAELAFRCLQHERDMRPTMGEVLKALRRIENEESDVQKAEEVDINSEDIGLLKSNPPPVSPDSVVADKGVNPTTPYSF
ncbi:LEAF RUST 10 DISEASE-RESISTANCE LOCUS RECEPTOR-LIKE PROTEIN KINASE-like 1.4 isoform X2 [Vitis vinifera]|uniref:LEAF RUST 10 DISEASE-RESISTANCE LOCUS RECEPTOR-LIKE PROTEIN KINASE-like 1.4 isoform X2 n=1 Tax=Vitis vinifera TaxID=29760 RepID=UPI000540318F|nr:LEAF RUST 10 DISEASE-RESISTANCE LOCUS RECEPTOR-LIKE PROTEIN KINASE-like 1.4 isoform X2 [Vitis vinifera]|eukprot:XP_010660403.1 PREDICTED: LEAF RUST 10 DISEASE-RESISTANCE LOCUS RECEPTOR-LIKE PROTEIN KINASE-like 1.4 isoform X2 [Vitis vinifera]